MQVSIAIQLVSAMVFICSMVIISFALFRVPIKGNDRQIAILSITVGCTNFYTKFILQTPYALIYTIIVYVIVLMCLRRYPIFYAFVVSITGLILVALIDAASTVTALRLQLSSIELMSKNTLHFLVMHSIVTVITFLLAFILVKLNIGFSFVKRRFTGKHSLRVHNFIWAIILIAGIAIVQFTIGTFSVFHLHSYIIVLSVLGLLASIIYAYFQNKKVLRDRNGG